MQERALACTFNFSDSTISYCELPRIGNSVVDDDELIAISDYDSPACDAIIVPLAPGEIVTEELKANLEERLRLRMAHANLCEPHIRLKHESEIIRIKGEANVRPT